MDMQARWLDRLITLRPTPAAAHGGAVALAASAVLIGMALGPFISNALPCTLLFPAVLLSALAGGAAAGVTAWIAGALLAWTFLFPQTAGGLLPGPMELTNLALYGLSGLLIVAVAHRLRDAILRRDAPLLQPAEGPSEETEHRTAQDTLERLVGERTRALEETNRLLLAEVGERERAEAALARAQRLEAIGQLTGGVAHDFNNLLTVIVGNLELIARTDEASERIRRLSAAALTAAERGERLTRQLLAFARRQTLRPEIADANRLIREGETLVRRAVGEAVDVHFDLDATLGPCRIDVAQFEAALLNLVVNARDATPAGGRITITTREANLSSGNTPDAPPDLPPGRYVVVVVRDTGTGIPPEIMPRVFEPFFTTKDIGKGSGLGLSQVYGFVRQSGGQVRVHSVIGQGTAVEIWLPRSVDDMPIANSSPDEDARSPRGAGETVLVVEDDAHVRAMAEETLQGLGYRVLVARDGVEAQTLLEGGASVDLLFADVVMPHGVTGTDLARRMRRERPDLRVLLTSGYTTRRCAADEPGTPSPPPLLPKPYRREALARAVRAVLAAGSVPEPSEKAVNRLRVLVVEDDVLVRMSTIEMLEDLDAEVVAEAASAEEALRLLDRLGDVDVLLTDLRLPGSDGVALAADALHLRPALYVVLATGFGADCLPPDGPAKLLILKKPFGTVELRSALEQARRVTVE